MNKTDYLQIYQNYLHALKIKQLYGDKYGDTDELIKMYEEILGIKKEEPYQLKKVKENKYES